ncbi:MAG: hypothetical protein M3329_09665 [Pseudomonadota bacterium]|nr:hypothetical protein [Pseudomonadota bacterium]
MSPIDHQIVRFRRLFLAHQPPHQAWMQDAGAAHKYRKQFHAITNGELARHLAGTLTLAAPLVGQDGTARAAALDLDTGGEQALWSVIAAAVSKARVAFGIACRGGRDGHGGGHVWLLFDQPAAPERLRQLAQELAAEAGVSAETYPTRKALRLPLGLHRWTGRRGQCLLPDNDTIGLDVGPNALAHALLAIDALPRNQVTQLPTIPRPAAPEPRPGHQRQAALGKMSFTIERYNQATDLVDLLLGYSGRIAEHFHGGGLIMHCPCGQHLHGDRRPSLELQPATHARNGRFIALGHAPRCAFYTERGQVINAFSAFCILEGLTPAQAVQRLCHEHTRPALGRRMA